MTARRALQIILGVGLFGLMFSGFLTYREFFAPAGAAAPSCSPIGAPGTIFGYPPCVYGFFMYLVIVALALWGLREKRPHPIPL
jgi:uncharacterized membrane protein